MLQTEVRSDFRLQKVIPHVFTGKLKIPDDLPSAEKTDFKLSQTLSASRVNTLIDFCVTESLFFNPELLKDVCKKFSSRIQSEDIDETNIRFGSPLSVSATSVYIISQYAKRTHDKELLKTIVYSSRCAKSIQNAMNKLKKYTPMQRNCIANETYLSLDDGSPFMCYLFLAMWIDDMFVPVMKKYINDCEGDNRKLLKNYIEMSFGFNGPFDDERNVKNWMEKLKQGLNDYVKQNYDYDAANDLIFHQAFEYGLFDLGRKREFNTIWESFNSLGYDVPNFHLYSDQDRMIDEIDESINLVLENYIISCYQDCVTDYNSMRTPKRDKQNPLLLSDNKKIEKSDFRHNQYEINKMMRSTDYSYLLMCCYTASVLERMRLEFKYSYSWLSAYKIDNLCADDAPDDLESACEEIKKLRASLESAQKKLDNNRLIKETEELKNKLEIVTNKLSEAKSGAEELRAVSKAAKDESAELRKKNKRLEREIEELNKKLSVERDRTECLKEQIKAIRDDDDEGAYNVDTNGKYLFVVEHDGMRNKLEQWFPNAQFSQKIDINSMNYKSFSLIVFMTMSISHAEFYRIKDGGINYGIPCVYCDNVNYSSIINAIGRRLSELERGKEKEA